ncbi:MAG: cytoplasmic protein [Bacillota bacterium]
MEKYVYFAFNGSQVSFIHVLLNALDMESKGLKALIIVEGEAVRLIKGMEASENPLYVKAKEKGLIDGICKACSAKMGVLDYNETVGIPLKDDMDGHPSMTAYVKEGYQVISL